MGRCFLEKIDGEDDYMITYGRHKKEKLSTALSKDAKYFTIFVLVQFPEKYCKIVERMAKESGVRV